MNKKELAGKVAQKVRLSRAKMENILDITLNYISDALMNGDKVRLVGFGNFMVRNRKGRLGRNPKSGEKIQISATKSPAFVAGSKLKKAIRLS